MITIKFKDKRKDLTFNMKDYKIESAFVDKFNDSDNKEGVRIDLKSKGKYLLNEIESMEFEECYYAQPIIEQDNNKQEEEKDFVSHLYSKMKEYNKDEEEVKFRAFCEMTKQKIGYIPFEHPMFDTTWETVKKSSISDLSFKMPLYINIMASAIKGK